MQILEDLYVGDIRPNERSFKRDSQYAEAMDEFVGFVENSEIPNYLMICDLSSLSSSKI